MKRYFVQPLTRTLDFLAGMSLLAAITLAVQVLIFFGFIPVAEGQTFTTYSTTWNGLSREYSVGLPATLSATPALVVVLHGTQNGSEAQTLLTATTAASIGMAWAGGLQNANGYILLTPLATWKQGINNQPGYRFWQAYGTDSFFPTVPDDSGFIRSLIQQLQTQYSIPRSRTFVTGMSSGGMMTYRVGVDSSDLVSAIAPVSGTAWVGSGSGVPAPTNPVSVLELHGDADLTIPYCGGTFSGWGEYRVAIPSVDSDMNYWLAADGLPSNLTPLCGATGATAQANLEVVGPNGVEVQFVRELGLGHAYRSWATGMIWEFFQRRSQ